MSHSDDEKITAFALGELEGTELETMKARVAASPELRRQVAEIQQFSHDLRAEFATEPLPPGRRVGRTPYKPAMVALSVTALACAGYLIAMNSPDNAPKAISEHRAKVILDAPGPALNANKEVAPTPVSPPPTETEKLALDLSGFGAALPPGTSEQEIRSVFESHATEILSCYKTADHTVAGLHGKIVFRWSLDPNGRAQDIVVADDGAGSLALAECVTTQMRRWKFPARKDTAEVSFPVQFRRH